MRIAPRTMLCATTGKAEAQESRSRFAELRELCSAAGDKVSLAIGMSGLATELVYSGRVARGVAVGVRTGGAARVDRRSHPTMGLAFVAFVTWFAIGDIGKVLRSTQTCIDLAGR